MATKTISLELDAYEKPGGAHEFLWRNRAVPFRVSVAAAMEYLEGFADRDSESATGFLRLFDLVVVDLHAAQGAGRIRRFLRGQGRLLPEADILIAACALRDSEPLVTDNLEHFSRIPGLEIVGYRDA